MMKFYKKLRDGGTKLVQDNEKELSYESGMMGPGSKTTTTSNKRKRRTVGCPNCGMLNHKRITSKLCLKNPNRCTEEELASVKDIATPTDRSNEEVVRQGVTTTKMMKRTKAA
jgi:hypothetical protein